MIFATFPQPQYHWANFLIASYFCATVRACYYKSIRSIIYLWFIITFHVVSSLTFCVHRSTSFEMTCISCLLFLDMKHETIIYSFHTEMHKSSLLSCWWSVCKCKLCKCKLTFHSKIVNPYFFESTNNVSFTMKILVSNIISVRHFIKYYMVGLLRVEFL